jgi:membrane protein DedA with SNARE-associated domain
MTEWLATEVNAWGYLGIFFLTLAARAIPPLPTEAVIPLAGMAAAAGSLNLWLVAIVGGLGSVAGELMWYAPARLWERERLERFLKRNARWLTIPPHKVRKVTRWFEKRGGWAVLACQPIGGLRTLIAIPAGACNLSLAKFVVPAFIGSALWTLVLAGSGYLVTRGWPELQHWVTWFALASVGLSVAVWLWRLVTGAGVEAPQVGCASRQVP